MIHITKKSSCCGCTACFNICPKNAISMQPDEEGFLYPVVDQEKCVDCGLCEKICPVSSKKSHEEQTDAYIIRYNNQKIVEESTSGGAFTAISSYVFENGGIVYGTGYDADMKVICKKAACMEDLKEMRGSKFVQSSLDRTFQEIKTELKTEKLILFTGTPCQVSGLIHYLGKHPENLISMDFVCRGVPSPGLWKNYVDYMEGKYHSKMIGARFKHKTYGYHTTTMKIDFQNGASYFGSGRVDPYMKAFVREMSSRPSCAECAFKGIERLSDITVFDCYEYTQIRAYFNKADRLVTISERCVKSLEKVFPECSSKIRMLYNISSTKMIWQLAEKNYPDEYRRKKNILVSIGRLNTQKGFDLAIQAAKIIEEKGVEFTWFIIGEGEDEQMLREQIKKERLDDSVKLVGIRKNPYPYIRYADVFVQPSRYEGKSIVLDEAKILCKPIVVTNYTTVVDSITDGVNGRIVQFDPNEIANGILELLNSDVQTKFETSLKGEIVKENLEVGNYIKLFMEMD